MKRLLGFCYIILIFVVACAPSPTPLTQVPAPKTRTPSVKVLRLGHGTYPDFLDPQKSASGSDIEALKLCYEGLTAIDAKGNIGPSAADKWELAKDGKSMTFHIREGLMRADGTPMNASDFEYALKREVDPRVTDKLNSDLIRDIKGADPLVDLEGQKISDDDLKKLYNNYGVKADDGKRELTLTFIQSIGYWNYTAQTVITYAPDKNKVDAVPDSWWKKAEGHNCYGPFKITSIEEGKRIVYEANRNYWRGRPMLDRVEATYDDDDGKRFEAYKRGEFDEVDVTATTLSQVEADPNIKENLIRYPSAITFILAFNNLRKPFDDKNVRIAFSQALDREGWIREMAKGIGKAYTRWIPPGVPGAQPDKPGVPATDPKAAVETLIKNGYGTADGKKVDCAKLGELKITYNSATEQNHARFQFLAGNFARVFNCPITLDPVDRAVYTALAKDSKTNPQISRQGWRQDYPYPQNWLSVYWTCGSFAIRYGYCNKNFDALMAKADSTSDFDQAIKLYQQAEDLLLSDIPGAPMYYSENLYLIKPYLIGLKENLSSNDFEWAGEWGPIWTYDIDLTKVPDSYPKQ